MLPLWLKLCLFIACIASNIVYIILLQIIYKRRREVPFNSSFFSFVFAMGLLDLLHLDEQWLFFRFPFFGWFRMHEIVMCAPRLIGTFNNFVGWFTALGQIAGTALLAFNRVSVIGYQWVWSPKTVRMCCVLLWLVPIAVCSPMLVIGQMTYRNISGGVVPYWINPQNAQPYYKACLYFCFASAIFSGLLYIMTLVRIRQQSAEAKQSGSPNQSNEAEIKLAVLGIVLFVLTVIYGMYCFSYSFIGNSRVLRTIVHVIQVIHSDMYSWINPYLLLMCSETTRQRFWEVLGMAGEKKVNNGVSVKVAHSHISQPHPVTVVKPSTPAFKVEEC